MASGLKLEKYCPECKDLFITHIRNKVFCCNKCVSDNFMKRTGRKSALQLPTGTVGTISELTISNDLLKKGYAVFRALSPACFCDVIAIRENKIHRIEIRTGYMNRILGTPTFSLKTHGTVDCFGIFFPLENQCKYYDLVRKEIEL